MNEMLCIYIGLGASVVILAAFGYRLLVDHTKGERS